MRLWLKFEEASGDEKRPTMRQFSFFSITGAAQVEDQADLRGTRVFSDSSPTSGKTISLRGGNHRS
jgi:hypothetical protein